jgi:hypothetical protein
VLRISLRRMYGLFSGFRPHDDPKQRAQVQGDLRDQRDHHLARARRGRRTFVRGLTLFDSAR